MDSFMTTGTAAKQLSVSVSMLRQLEREGITPPARRLVGQDRRIYSEADVVTLERIIAERRAQLGRRECRTA